MIDTNYNETNNCSNDLNPCQYSGFVEVDCFRRNSKGGALIKLRGTIKPEILKVCNVLYRCVYKPEYGDFFELRPEKGKEIGSFKDYLEIVK